MGNFKENYSNKYVYWLFFLVSIVTIYFLRVNKGLDLSDAGYSLARYRLFSGQGLDTNFLLSNKFGNLILKINNNAYFLRLVSYIIYVILGVISFLFWKNHNYSNKISIISSVISIIIALEFPLEIIHNPLTSLFVFIIFIFTIMSIEKDEISWIIISSYISCVLVLLRISNVFFIISIFAFLLIKDYKRALIYISNIIIGFLLVLFLIYISGRIERIFELVNFLKYALIKSSSHNILSLLKLYFRDAFFIVVGVFVFSIADKKIDFKFNQEQNVLLVILFVVAYIVLGYIFVPIKNVFEIKSVFYKLMILLISYYAFTAFRIRDNFLEKLSIVIFFTFTLGTSNIFHYCKIAMFFVLPPFLTWANKNIKQYFVSSSVVSIALVSVISLNSILFPYRDELIFGLNYETSIPNLKKIKTSKIKAESLNRIYKTLNTIDWNKNRLITDGSMPMFSYITEAYSVHNTTWPDLPSYDINKYEKEINKAKKGIVIIDNKLATINNYWIYDSDYNSRLSDKEKILQNVINERKLKVIYEDKNFIVWN